MKITLRNLLYATQWSLGVFVLYALFGKTLVSTLRSYGFVAIAVILAMYFKKRWELSLWIEVPIALIFLYLLVWAFLLVRLLVFVPFPYCRKGKCHSIDDYAWCHGQFFGKFRWGVYWYQCRCGDQYLRRGKRFMDFIPEVQVRPSPWININKGTTHPYKRLVGFRKWAEDVEIN